MFLRPLPVVRGTEKNVKRGGGKNLLSSCREWYERRFSSPALFAAGLCAMPALLFNPSVAGRAVQFLFFWVLVLLVGKKSNHPATLLAILGILFFNLLFPYGEVLFSIGPFLKVSSGALEAGLRRGITLEGLFMLSRLTVRQDLRLPGGFGELIGESFRILAVLTEKKNTISAKNLIAGIDGLMLELSAPDAAGDAPEAAARDKAEKPARFPGLFILAAAVVLAWLPWLFFRD
jgi:heptaprenyl diphosphate synthase